MRRRSSLFWAVLVVATAGALVYGPAYLASRATGPGEPVDFMTRPQDGWRFLLDVVPHVGAARAGTPAQARARALAAFAGSRVRPARVELLWEPARTLSVAVRARARRISTPSRLVWRVIGRAASGKARTVGLIDWSTGRLVFRAPAAR